MLDFLNHLVSVRKLHSGVAKHHLECIMWKCTLYNIKGYNAIFSTTERHIKNIHLILIGKVRVVNLLNCLLRKRFQNVAVFLDHAVNIDELQRFAIWFRVFQWDQLRGCVK